MNPLVLASASPRRAEILRAMAIPFEVMVSSVDESRIAADHPRTFALRAAFAKARDVAATLPEGRWVLAADTVVTRNLVLYGKPTDAAHAELSNGPHQVITGVALAQSGSANTFLRAETTRVTFRPLTADEIRAYITTGEPMDKAGAYGIQGLGADLIAHLDGDYYNVVGLPSDVVIDLLTEAGAPYEPTPLRAPVRWMQ
jgi:septum formation protein